MRLRLFATVVLTVGIAASSVACGGKDDNAGTSTATSAATVAPPEASASPVVSAPTASNAAGKQIGDIGGWLWNRFPNISTIMKGETYDINWGRNCRFRLAAGSQLLDTTDDVIELDGRYAANLNDPSRTGNVQLTQLARPMKLAFGDLNQAAITQHFDTGRCGDINAIGSNKP